MPLFQPETHTPGVDLVLTTSNCPGCPHAWFRSGFAEQDTQGCWVRVSFGVFVWSGAPLDELIAQFGEQNVYEVGRDGYYLTLAEARLAIDGGVHGIRYVDDYNIEYQSYYLCKDDEDHTPFAEAHVAEPIR